MSTNPTTPVGTTAGGDPFRSQDLFPQEWVDSRSPNARPALVSDIYDHVKGFLKSENESPLRDAPFDVVDDWAAIGGDPISFELLKALTDREGQGLSLSPTAVYLLVTRMFITTSDELYEFLVGLPATDADNKLVATAVVNALGPQAVYAHAHEYARLVVFRNYIEWTNQRPSDAIVFEDSQTTPPTRTFHFERISWKTMRKRYNPDLRSVTTQLREYALTAASTIVNRWKNLSADMQSAAHLQTPNGQLRMSLQATPNPSATVTPPTVGTAPPSTPTGSQVSSSATSMGRSRLPFASPLGQHLGPRRTIDTRSGTPRDMIYSPLKHLARDGSVVLENPNAVVPDFDAKFMDFPGLNPRSLPFHPKNRLTN